MVSPTLHKVNPSDTFGLRIFILPHELPQKVGLFCWSVRIFLSEAPARFFCEKGNGKGLGRHRRMRAREEANLYRRRLLRFVLEFSATQLRMIVRIVQGPHRDPSTPRRRGHRDQYIDPLGARQHPFLRFCNLCS
jgi:hypothetical protein